MSELDNQRFHMYPRKRIEALASTAGTVGMLAGFYDGTKESSLRYLVENGHRLPRTVGQWYFYHKRKNYVMVLDGTRSAFRQGLKYSAAVGSVFALEALIDTHVRNGTVDFGSTTVAAATVPGIYGIMLGFTRIQTMNLVRRGAAFGLSLGIAQDLLIFARGGRVWYLDALGIKQSRSLNHS